jgi:N-methylhydantoinase B
MGARPTKDGKDGVQVHITNTSNLPIEAIEMEYPLLVDEYSLVEDSAGAGKYRGGMGLRRVITPRHDNCIFNGAGERFRHQPWGLFGGSAGGAGRFLLRSPEKLTRLDNKPDAVKVSRDSAVVIETPGAGGYGPPSERTAEKLRADRETGKFSDDYLTRHYGTDDRS